MQANYRQFGREAVLRGLISQDELDGAIALLDDPTIIVHFLNMWTVRGRRPRDLRQTMRVCGTRYNE